MKPLDQAFKDQFFILLQKSSYFTLKEARALWAIIATIVDTRSFSLSEVSRRCGRKVGRNFLTNVLKKYAYVQRELAKLTVRTIATELPRNARMSIITDDMIVRKRGKQMLGVFRWYDHTIRRSVRAWCLVNVALVVQNQVVFVMPWLLTRVPPPKKQRQQKTIEQDIKTKAAIAMFDHLVRWLTAGGVRPKHITILADSWYSAQRMMVWVRQAQVLFRIDGKKNYNVQMPDHEAIEAAKDQTKGRRRTIFIKYRRLEEYLGSPLEWSYFTCPETTKRVYYASALVTLRTTGRVRVYAFRRQGTKDAKFILTSPVIKRPPTPKSVYLDYRQRWRIEEVHRDLKQHFRVGKCYCRDDWAVSGFLGCIYFAYTTLRFTVFTQEQSDVEAWACPTWANEFHKTQISLLQGAPAT